MAAVSLSCAAAPASDTQQVDAAVARLATGYPQLEACLTPLEAETDTPTKGLSAFSDDEWARIFGQAADVDSEVPTTIEPEGETLFDSSCAVYEGLEDQALLDQIYEEVRDHVTLGYAIARDHMYGRREPVIDVFDGKVECVYTGRLAVPDGTRTPENMNTEHSWPQSKGSKDEPARSDIHHLFITDQGVNSRRQNFEYGDTDCNDPNQVECSWEGPNVEGYPSQLGFDADGQRVFEVRSARRGDIARGQFYFAARYQMPILPQTEAALRRWHQEDPPDWREKERNRRIELVQGNRNPFIDCPRLVESIADF